MYPSVWIDVFLLITILLVFFIFFSNVIKRFFERYDEKEREGGGSDLWGWLVIMSLLKEPDSNNEPLFPITKQ